MKQHAPMKFRLVALLASHPTNIQKSGERGIPLYTSFEVNSLQDEIQFDLELSKWITSSSTDIFQKDATHSLFVPELQSVNQATSGKLKGAWQDLCLNYGMLCQDLSDLVTISRNAATTDALENSLLPESFPIRTSLLRTMQSFVMRNRAIWEKVMNVLVLSADDEAATEAWEKKEKSVKKKFEKVQKRLPNHIPEWFAKAVLGGKRDPWKGGAIELFDDMFRTPEIHGPGTLRKWALAQSIQIRTIDIIQSFFKLTEMTIQNLQLGLEGTPRLVSSRSAYFELAVELMLRVEAHDKYSTEYRSNFKAIAEVLAHSDQDKLDLFLLDLEWAFPQFQYADTPDLKWRDYLQKIDAHMVSHPDNQRLKDLRPRLMDCRRDDLSYLELIELTQYHRLHGHRRYREIKDLQIDRCHLANKTDINLLDAANLYDFGLKMKDLGYLDKAIESYTVLYEKYPNKHRALAGKAVCLAEAGRLNEASTTLDLLTQKSPADINNQYLRGIVACHSGDYALSMDNTTTVLERDPNWAAAWSLAGLASLKQHHYDMAISCFSKAIELAPRLKDAIFNLGYTHFEKGDHLSAKPVFQEVLDQNPNDHEAAFYLTNILYAEDRVGNRDAIIRWAVVAFRGGPQWQSMRDILTDVLSDVPRLGRVPTWQVTFLDPHINQLFEVASLLTEHQYYRPALQLWSDIADTVNLFVGSANSRLLHDVTLLYWGARDAYRGQDTNWVAQDKRDEAEAVFNALLEEVLPVYLRDRSFDPHLVGNIWMQLAQISHARAIDAVDVESKKQLLDTALKYAIDGNEAANSETKTKYIFSLRDEIQTLTGGK